MTLITIKVNTEEQEEKILYELKKFCTFQFASPCEIEVCGKQKTIRNE